ncbi:hypothetical protein SAMN04488056_12137 [Cohaesibacter marisflavi]|uniref:Uncharacterized protein n=1 Tax=Cohaesibacter marisflavi TaxID=655353 RepID=A0A1I5MGY3_9HYPH|nr:hypothetical protein [Cohaesibacter marisflavi]SFP08908.1 hypothetical protein SAMN04488056_12137 [Cohaesibacter marisflavi]
MIKVVLSALIFASSITMTGCSTFSKTEMPIKPDGVDEMRKSPCACTEIQYQAPRFEWVG